jgi:hypothetical protein
MIHFLGNKKKTALALIVLSTLTASLYAAPLTCNDLNGKWEGNFSHGIKDIQLNIATVKNQNPTGDINFKDNKIDKASEFNFTDGTCTVSADGKVVSLTLSSDTDVTSTLSAQLKKKNSLSIASFSYRYNDKNDPSRTNNGTGTLIKK